ncbi:sugar ABC transporter ATP-binding protein [Mesorhizobium sp. M3A.F.Ca.ET.201.01.1.1]|uniref:sugar ABC transporter ATP-binding protein n=1 Tax=Mesorhizobium sp. M3A.F.Ca.ET.201.01.1.1 TaxID=2563946 RepID=UPI0010939A4F|nr:sugar ABC transporter ATP-binding protein [Mesorhizobium sp. M3A.F.Ca.ET.201.01.1.1]TGS71687.1 sugar ABC transporter ATP-binding protein [Mesorhizobium sp. M3A.F.Ca.ET.201.01.1.1]
MTPVLSARNIGKTYPGVRALHDVSMELRPNEVLGLIGQNGSGKSTLLKVLSGLEQPSTGKLSLRGREAVVRSPLAAARLGIGLVHQEQSLIPNLTVAENIFFDKPSPHRRFGIYNWRGLNREAARQLAKLECDIAPDTRVDALSFPDRQMVEFAKVLAIEELIDQPLVVLFDEPTSLLSPSEVDDLFRQIRRLRSRASIVFVSHRMEEVLEISDRVHVMVNGENVAERTRDTTNHEELYHLMVGSRRSDDYYQESGREPVRAAAPRLVVDGLSAPGRFRDVSLSARPGEIVAVTGVAGSGAESFCRAIFGAEDGVRGIVRIADEELVSSALPDAAIRSGVGYVPAERKLEGVIVGRTVLENIVLTFGPQMGKAGLINRRKETGEALSWINRLHVKTPSPVEYVERLSGGNQQKVSLAKWLMSDRLQVLILDHPTRGLDPGAKADLFGLMRELARQGLTIVFVSETLEETLGMADTVVVMRDGEVSARFEDLCLRKPRPEQIVEAMV